MGVESPSLLNSKIDTSFRIFGIFTVLLAGIIKKEKRKKKRKRGREEKEGKEEERGGEGREDWVLQTSSCILLFAGGGLVAIVSEQ